MKRVEEMTLAEVSEALKGSGGLAVRFAYVVYEAKLRLLSEEIHINHQVLKAPIERRLPCQ